MEIYLRDTLHQLATLPEYRGKIIEVLVPMAKSVRSLGKSLRLIEQPLHKGKKKKEKKKKKKKKKKE